ncbi:hypothetical protein ABVK25_012364 [Lepraria finkii]|uniref:Uncharacterized protein n=1 Tax=Lepraria finkii TaxID=1340010 RepID=A0ABR4AFK9_9LECA
MTMIRAPVALPNVAYKRVDDYHNGKRWWRRRKEKGGRFHEVPAHHNAETYLDEYLRAAGIEDDRKVAAVPGGAGKDRHTANHRAMNRSMLLAGRLNSGRAKSRSWQDYPIACAATPAPPESPHTL